MHIQKVKHSCFDSETANQLFFAEGATAATPLIDGCDDGAPRLWGFYLQSAYL